MNLIERIAVVSLLKDLIEVVLKAAPFWEHTKDRCDPDEWPSVGNGETCPCCFARGWGSSELHKRDCKLVRTVRYAREIMSKLEREM